MLAIKFQLYFSQEYGLSPKAVKPSKLHDISYSLLKIFYSLLNISAIGQRNKTAFAFLRTWIPVYFTTNKMKRNQSSNSSLILKNRIIGEEEI